jgi:hypothetical protein
MRNDCPRGQFPRLLIYEPPGWQVNQHHFQHRSADFPHMLHALRKRAAVLSVSRQYGLSVGPSFRAAPLTC